MTDFDTRAVRSGRGRSPGSAAGPFEPHAPAIDLSSTYGFDRSDVATASLDALAAGAPSAENPIYGRLHNPTVAGFEDGLAALEEAEAAVAFASGMAAISALILTAGSESVPAGAARGSHVVGVRPVYGGTDHVLTSGMLGKHVTWVDAIHVAAAIRPDTALVLLETPANPTLEMVDVRDLVRQVRAAQEIGSHIPVAVDSTFATPVLQNPLTLGADLVVHSATKFLGGHGDVVGGVIATSEQWARPLRQVRLATGGILHPLAGYLLHRGLQTLPIRVRAQQETASELAGRLSRHPAVTRVFYPGLSGDPVEVALLRSQQRGSGSVLSFTVAGGPDAAVRVMESLQLVTRAVSLGSVDSLIQMPAALTHRIVDPADRRASGVSDDLLRMSVGLESVEDLWDDLSRALNVAQTGGTRASDSPASYALAGAVN